MKKRDMSFELLRLASHLRRCRPHDGKCLCGSRTGERSPWTGEFWCDHCVEKEREFDKRHALAA